MGGVTDFYQNINWYLLHSLIRSRTSIYLLNSIANNASNIDVYVRLTAGRTISGYVRIANRAPQRVRSESEWELAKRNDISGNITS